MAMIHSLPLADSPTMKVTGAQAFTLLRRRGWLFMEEHTHMFPYGQFSNK